MAKVINIPNQIFTFEVEETPYQANPIRYYIDENSCHICVSHCTDKKGYPRIGSDYKDLRMSRFIWKYVNKREIPRGMLIMHTCDNPNCINPDHLKLGTHKENMADMIRKGRSLKGSKHPRAKLNEADVYFIKYESEDINLSFLAEMYQITKDHIRDIRKGKCWKHVTKDANTKLTIAKKVF